MRVGLCVLVALAMTGTAMGCDSAPEFPPCDIEPTMSSIQAKAFTVSCVFDDCHDSRRPEADLDLSTTGQALHDQLINVLVDDENAAARGKLRVVPGDPDASFLYQKLEGTHAEDEGDLMPNGVEEPLDPMCLNAMIREWIEDGAPNN